MDDRHPALENSSPLESVIDRFVKELVAERIENGEIDLATMPFAEIEQMGHAIGRRLATGFDQQLCAQQGLLHSNDYDCPTCGLECEAIKHPRTIHTIDGPSEIIELKSYCPQCRRYFFPCA